MAFTGAIKGITGRKNQFAWIIYKKNAWKDALTQKPRQVCVVWEMGNEKRLPEGRRLVICVTVSRSSNNDSKPFQSQCIYFNPPFSTNAHSIKP